MTKIDQISQDVKILRERLVEKIPGHFGTKHIVTAFFGALFFGFTFVLKGLLFEIGLALNTKHLILIILATLLTLTLEIYFVGYTRVTDKKQRPFGQFWLKRITTYYLIAMFTSILLLSLYGVMILVAEPFDIFRLTIAISYPAAVGAATSDLLGKY